MPITLSKNQLHILYKALLDAIAYRNDAWHEEDLVDLRNYEKMSEHIYEAMHAEKEVDEDKYW